MAHRAAGDLAESEHRAPHSARTPGVGALRDLSGGVFFTYYFTSTSSRLKVKSPPSITGALFGLINAYILGMTLFPFIPNGLPAPSIILQNRELAQAGIDAFQAIMTSLGVDLKASTLTLIVFFLVALITIQAVRAAPTMAQITVSVCGCDVGPIEALWITVVVMFVFIGIAWVRQGVGVHHRDSGGIAVVQSLR
ncbi:MAG: hypothetical protein HZY76_08530 [Anaerolineae bacterium]|nr:MAG: hypothetical protein HZY76_08530 [Anaerolineae bacterium]